MNKLLSILFLICLLFIGYFIGMCWGWGLTVQSWPWLISGLTIHIVVTILIKTIANEE